MRLCLGSDCVFGLAGDEQLNLIDSRPCLVPNFCFGFEKLMQVWPEDWMLSVVFFFF